MPKISVVLPSYNGEKYIAQSIQSVIDQTEQDWELIIVNDCSTDDTLKICEQFAKKDKRIKVISNKINKKLPASLNVGFGAANGKYLTWTSDDNYYKPDALKKMADYLDKNDDVDLVSMCFDVMDENDKFMWFLGQYDKYQRCEAALLLGNNVGAAFMYRKSIADKIGGYDTNTFCAEDYDYWCRIALNGKIEYTNDNIYVYRLQPNSLTATRKETIKEKTKYIQRKYANEFFKKFNFTELDKAHFFKDVLKEKNSKYRFKILKISLLKNLCNLIFWSKNLRHKTRDKILNYKFSFLQLNKEEDK